MESISELTAYFEKCFRLFNDNFFDTTLPKTVITIQSTPNDYGHASVKKIWYGNKTESYELNLSAEYLRRPTEFVLTTLLHEMVHIYCREHGIKEVSRNGTYHNKRFKSECEKREMIVEKMNGYGWASTLPTHKLIKFMEKNKLVQPIPFFRKGHSLDKKKDQKKNNSRKYTCPSCNKIVRATSEVSIICGYCGVFYQEKN